MNITMTKKYLQGVSPHSTMMVMKQRTRKGTDRKTGGCDYMYHNYNVHRIILSVETGSHALIMERRL